MKKKVIIIKLGGAALNDSATLQEAAKLIKGYRKKHYKVALVHGGGPAINQELTARGLTWKFIDGQRQTTAQMMAVIEQVLGLQVNSKIVETLQAHGVRAKALSSVNHNIFSCVPMNPELGQVGRVKSVNTTAVELCLLAELSVVPVIAPIGRGHGDSYNINADIAAVELAIALGAEKLIFLTDQLGILDEKRQLLEIADAKSLNEMIRSGVIAGGMLTKVQAMQKAVAHGVKEVRVLKACHAGDLLKVASVGTVLVEHAMNRLTEEKYVRTS